MRLDAFIFSKGYTDSRTEAKSFITDGAVTVNGKTVKKPAFDVSENDVITVDKTSKKFTYGVAHNGEGTLTAEYYTTFVELTDSEIINMIKNYNKKFKENANVELLTYGRVENMLIKGNILGIEENKHNYNLIDLKRRKFPVYYDGENTHLLNFTTKEITDKNILKNVNTLRFDFYEETAEDIKKIVKQFQ